jgi:hypothetical protein
LDVLKSSPGEALKEFKPREPRAPSAVDSDGWTQYLSRHFVGDAVAAPAAQQNPPPGLTTPFQRPTYFDFLRLIRQELGRMSANTASGVDGMAFPFLKYAYDPTAQAPAGEQRPPNILAPALATWFHSLFIRQQIPAVWKVARITPIFKDGDPTDPGRYRMIAVSSALYRLYANVLRCLIFPWCKAAKAVPDTQFGFYPGRNTMHPIFILRHLTQLRAQYRKFTARYPALEAEGTDGCMYMAFVDFTQAYDHIPRDLLWHHLENKVCLPAPLLAALKSLYENDQYMVVDGTSRSQNVQPNKGVKQGCPLSPLLFALYISDMGSAWQGFPNGVSVGTGDALRYITHLLYADDLVLLAATPQLLQQMLDLLRPYAHSKHLTLNVKKSKVLVYTPPRTRIPDVPPIYWQGSRLEVVDRFRYLGLELNGSFCLEHAATRVRASLFAARHRVYTLAAQQGVRKSPLVMLHLFRNFVLPHAMYGCQVWGVEYLDHLQTTTNPLQQTYTSFFRQLLGVRGSVAHNMILHEVAQPPLQFYWLRAACRFLNGMVKADSPLLTAVVRSDIELGLGIGSQQGQGVWPEAWTHRLYQAVTDLVPQTSETTSGWRHLEHLELSTIDVTNVMQAWNTRWQARWDEFIGDPRAEETQYREQATYASWFKVGEGMRWRDLPTYLSSNLHEHTWRTMAKLRLGNHGLAVEKGRHRNVPYSDRICERCFVHDNSWVVDDVHHVLFDCFSSLRFRVLDTYRQDVESSGADVRAFMQTASFTPFVRDVFDWIKPP